MAATADLPGSTYVGPDGLLQMKGLPRIVNARASPTTGRHSAGSGSSARRPPA